MYLDTFIEEIKKFLARFKKQRSPASCVDAVALTGALIISTKDGNNIVITPKLARELAPKLPALADKADGKMPA